MAEANIVQITPFMHVPDLEAALNWFALIGFEPLFRQADYAYVARGPVAVRVLESRDETGACHVPHEGFACYVDVQDVDAVHREVAAKLAAASVEVMGPVDQAYGQRELMIRAPDGNVFVFGQAVQRRKPSDD